jgi:hypothetical protein
MISAFGLSPVWQVFRPSFPRLDGVSASPRNLQHSKPANVFNSEDNIDNSIVNNSG